MFTAVTVAFNREVPILKLQARSLDQFVNWVDEIILIDNESNGCDLREIIPWYGRHADKVKIIHAREIAPNAGPDPYYDQMSLKILSHAYCNNQHVILLDSKNWFIKQIDINKVFNNGLYLGERYPLTEPWNNTWRNSLELFNLSVPTLDGIAISCRTPFFMNRNELSELDNMLNIWNLISVRRRYTEFTLINAYIIKKYGSLSNYFHHSEPNGYCSGVWPGYLMDEPISERLRGREFRNSHIFCTGMHRKVWSTLNIETASDIARGWNELNLFGHDEGIKLIQDMAKLNPRE